MICRRKSQLFATADYLVGFLQIAPTKAILYIQHDVPGIFAGLKLQRICTHVQVPSGRRSQWVEAAGEKQDQEMPVYPPQLQASRATLHCS